MLREWGAVPLRLAAVDATVELTGVAGGGEEAEATRAPTVEVNSGSAKGEMERTTGRRQLETGGADFLFEGAVGGAWVDEGGGRRWEGVVVTLKF